MLVAAAAYLVIGVLVLAPAIRPGQTLVAADLLYVVQPFSGLPVDREFDNALLSDIPFQFFPWLDFVGDAFRDGRFPEWNPSISNGVPVTPSGFVNVYYPGFWLFGLMAPFDAYNLFVLIHLVSAALGVFVLARMHGARSVAAGIAGSLVFASSFWVHWSTHLIHLVGMTWLPWALVATHLLVSAPSRRRVVVLASVFGVWWLGANPQYAYYGTLAMLAYAGGLLAHRRLVRRQPVVRAALAYAAALGLGVALMAPVLLPTVQRAERIVRQREPQPSTDHMPKQQAIRALVPDAYGNPADDVYFGGRTNDELVMDSPFVGVTAVLLVAAAVATVGRRNPLRWILVAGLAGAVLLAYTGQPHRLLYNVMPGYDRFRGAARWLSILPAFALPLAALGLDDLLIGGRRSRLALSVAAAASAAALTAWYLWVRGVDGAPVGYFGPRVALAGAVILAVGVAAHLLPRWPGIGMAVVSACAVAEIAFYTPRWYPEVEERTAFPDVAVSDIARQRGGNLIRVGAERTTFPAFAPNLAMAYGAGEIQAQAVLFPADVDRFLRIIDDYGDYTRLFNAPPPLAAGAMLTSPLLDVLDVRTVVAGRDTEIPAQFPLLDEGDPNVYGRNSLGPAFVVPSAEPVAEEEMWRRVAAPAWDPAGTAAVVGLKRSVTGSQGTAVQTDDDSDSDRESWQVDAPAGGFLRVSGNWDEGWTARLDGRTTPVLRADGIFRGVVVPPGRHQVEFSYRNPSERTGRLVAAASLAALGLLLLPVHRSGSAALAGLRPPRRGSGRRS